MKPQQVRDLDEQELKAKIHEIQEQAFRLRFQMKMGQADGLKKLGIENVPAIATRGVLLDMAGLLGSDPVKEGTPFELAIQSRDSNGAVSKG